MRALIPFSLLLLLAACEIPLNEGLSRVAIIEPPQSPLSVSYKCEEGPAISVVFFERGGTATVAVIGIGQEVLYKQPVETGYHYRSEGFDLKGNGDTVRWSQTGGLSTTCKAVGDRI
ncbi:MAG: MliC family protein [Pseudomonadota bacterium]